MKLKGSGMAKQEGKQARTRIDKETVGRRSRLGRGNGQSAATEAACPQSLGELPNWEHRTSRHSQAGCATLSSSGRTKTAHLGSSACLSEHLPRKGRLTRQRLREYDRNIFEHTERINVKRDKAIRWRYFQYLALLFVEIYLDRYFGDEGGLAETTSTKPLRI